jgi:hypothetical protein
VEGRIRERNEENLIQEKGKENGRKLGKEIDGGERGEGRRRMDGAGKREGELDKGGKRNGWSRVGRRMREREEEKWG